MDPATMVFMSFFGLSAVSVFIGRSMRTRSLRATWVTLAHLPGYYSVYVVWSGVAKAQDYVLRLSPLGVKGLMAADPFSSFMALVAVFGSHMTMLYAAMVVEDTDSFARFTAAGLAGTGAVIATLYSINLAAMAILWEATVAAQTGIILLGRGEHVIEAAVKTAAMALLSSLLLATGLGMLFVSLEPTGVTLNLFTIPWVASHIPLAYQGSGTLILISFAFILASFGIEIGAAPFYMWLPDMYTGSRPEAVALVVTTVDLGGMYLMARVTGMYAHLPVARVPALGGLTPILLAVVILSLFSMSLGELSALGQSKIRRVLSYSSVADAGYVLLLSTYFFWGGTVPYGRTAFAAQALAYFVVTSNLSIAAAVACAGYLERRLQGMDLDSFRGAARLYPLASVLLALSLLSLFGVPPMAGFIAKFLVVSALVTAPFPAMLGVAAVATVFFVVSAAYGMRIIGACAATVEREVQPVQRDIAPLMPVLLIVIFLIVVGVNPGLLLSIFAG